MQHSIKESFFFHTFKKAVIINGKRNVFWYGRKIAFQSEFLKNESEIDWKITIESILRKTSYESELGSLFVVFASKFFLTHLWFFMFYQKFILQNLFDLFGKAFIFVHFVVFMLTEKIKKVMKV